MSTYSDFDNQSLREAPAHRSCFRAFIQGPVQVPGSINSQNCSSYSDEKPDRNSHYDLLDHRSDFPFEDSFFSSGSGHTASTSSGTKWKKPKSRNKVSGVVCRMNIKPQGSDRKQKGDAMTVASGNSHRGLLSNPIRDSGVMDVLDRNDALTWKTAKTTTSSSVASSGNRSRISRNNTSKDSGAFPVFNNREEHFEFMNLDDIQRRSLGKTFGGCVSLVSSKKKKNRDRDREEMNSVVEEPVPPKMPESPQFFKFHNAIVEQNTGFPQIIFANDVIAESNQFENDAFRRNSTLDQGVSSPVIMPPFVGNNNMERISRSFRGKTHSRSPSPTNRSYNRRISSFDFDNSSPRSKESRSRGRNPSPRSTRSMKEEEVFLDNLANALTSYNSYQKDKNTSNGRSILNRLMEENQQEVPEFVQFTITNDFDVEEDDDVSDVGMASTSGGRKEPSSENNSPQWHRKKDPNDYFDPTVKRGTKNENVPVASKLKAVDERSLKWRLRDAVRQSTEIKTIKRCPSLEFMQTGKSLLDHDISGSTTEGLVVEEPSFDHVDSGVRKAPLKLSDAFEDFGVDNRRHEGKHHTANIHKYIGLGDDHNNVHNSDQFFSRASGRGMIYSTTPVQQSIEDPEQSNRIARANVSKISRRNLNEEWRKEKKTNLTNPHLAEQDITEVPLPQATGDKGQWIEERRRSNPIKSYVTNHDSQQFNAPVLSQSLTSSLPRTNEPEVSGEVIASPALYSSRRKSIPRSSKYSQVNGAPCKLNKKSLDNEPMLSMESPKWSSTSNNSSSMTSNNKDMFDRDGFQSNHMRRSPQCIADYNPL